jgi:hypothetical protein
MRGAAVAIPWIACVTPSRGVPAPARAFVSGLLKAREAGLDFDEALEDVAEYQEAYECWIAGLEA